MNNLCFNNIVKGRYGRKTAYANYESVDENNVIDIVNRGMSIFYYNKPAIEYLWGYVHGDQPSLYRKKIVRDDIVNYVVENHAWEIVQFKTSQTYGEPIQYISRKDDESINKAVDLLNDYVIDVHKQARDIKSGEWQSAVGTAYKAVQRAAGMDTPFRIVVPTPLNTFVIYSKITEEPLLAVQILENNNNEVYWLCFSENKQFTIYNNTLTETKLHAFDGIPIVEYPNNAERISDVELVITMLDAINNMQSNRMDAIEQFVQSWVKFINCDIDRERYEEMKKAGALVVNSPNGSENKADVEIMTQELNQTESQVAKDDLWNNILTISAIPNKEGNTGGDTQGAVELRNGWDFSKQRAKLKDPFVIESEKRLAKVILGILRLEGKGLNITTKDFDVQINHSPTDNMIVKAQSLQYLLECGINPLIAIKTCGLWGDSEKTFLLSKPYLDNLYKTAQDIEQQENQMKKPTNEINNTQNQIATE